MKLLVLHVDTVAIWDVKEGEVINELRSPKVNYSQPKILKKNKHFGNIFDFAIYLVIANVEKNLYLKCFRNVHNELYFKVPVSQIFQF